MVNTAHEAAGEDVNWGGNAVSRYLPYLPREKFDEI